MIPMIPVQYRVLAWLLLALALFGAGVASGHNWATTRAEAARAKLVDAQLKRLQQEAQRADALARQVGAAESRIVVKTVEVIKHVPSVTTGRLCLGADAVGLLQPGADWLYPTPGVAAANRAGDAAAADRNAASDRDVALWIADAHRHYETCAGRLNALVGWFDGDAE